MRVRVSTAVSLLVLTLAQPGAGEPPRPSVPVRLGHAPDARLLVIHADDLGMSHSVNRATFEALEKGWVTSASILVPCPWFPEVARFAKEHPEADLGIHLALTSEWTFYRWGPVSPHDAVRSLLDEEGYFPLTGPPVVEKAALPEVERELEAQVARARSSGVRLSHLDTHMGTLAGSAGLLGVYRRLGAAHRLPVLLERQGRAPAGAVVPDAEILVDRVLGIEPGIALSDWRAAYEKLLAPLPPGVYELIVHLAYDDEEMRGATRDHPDWGAAWRQADFDLVRSPAFKEFLERQGFVLVRWSDLARALP